MSGFGNGFESEALPVGRNSPQKCPYGPYAEQLSGSPFTAPRVSNERSWRYRIRPTVKHWGRFEEIDAGFRRTAPHTEIKRPIQPLRWAPIPPPTEKLSFVEGIRTITTAADGRRCNSGGLPLQNDQSLRGILVGGTGEFASYEMKLFYVNGLFSGQARPGQIIGLAMDLSRNCPGITNHIHFEMTFKGQTIDPRSCFLSCF
jgi:homogentisate 1,2-dioxygenase